MGLTQSQVDFFHDANQVDGDQIEVYEYLQRVERSLWREEPWWQQQRQQALGDATHDACVHSAKAITETATATLTQSNEAALASIDSAKPLTFKEALVAVPKMMHDGWVAPLVALIESVDTVVQSIALALLSKIVKSASAESIFIRVGGMGKLVDLLYSDLANVQYLALEVIYALCARNAYIVPQFCQLGLVRHLTSLTKSDAPELVLAALKILRLTLHQDAVKAEMVPCTMLNVLMELIASPHTAIAKASIICIGLSLPNVENLAEIVRLGCIDAFLKLMAPSNPNADAVIYALSLIADETDAIFPRELTITASLRMLETLRGAAKRSKNASAMGFLFAALAKSPVFHAALCTESSLSILSKLLVGGSVDVLCAAAFALGVVVTHARDDSVKELLFRVDAPQNLMKLFSSAASSSSSSAASSERVVRLAIFALACMLHDGAILAASGSAVYPEVVFSDSLRTKMLSCCQALLSAPALVTQIYDRAVLQLSIGSTYAAKLLACLSVDDAIKRKCCNALCVQRMLAYTRAASPMFLATCLAFFVECTNPTERTASARSSSEQYALAPTESVQATVLSSPTTAAAASSEAFCVCILRHGNSTEHDPSRPDAYVSLVELLFKAHQPDCLFGLPVLLRNFVECTSVMKTALSVRSVVDPALVAATRLNHAALHDQVLQFLDALTRQKNDRALRVLFETDPERVANLLHSPYTHIQLLAATLLRRMFKRLNTSEIPSVATKRQLVKLVTSGAASDTGADATGGAEREVAVAAARVWGNLFLYDDKRVGFAKIPHATEALLLLLHACAGDCNGSGTAQTASSSTRSAASSAPHNKAAVSVKNLHVTMRSVHRAALSDDVKRVAVTASHFLCVVDLFTHSDERVVHLAIETLIGIARLPALRKHVAVATVLTAVNVILRDHADSGASRSRTVARIDCLRLVSELGKKDAWTQRLLLEYKIVDAAVLLLHSPLVALDWQLLHQSLETLAWIASGAESPVRCILSTAKLVDFALHHTDSSREQVTSAALHLLQRLSTEPNVQDMVNTANGPAIIMRALSNCSDSETKRRACPLIRNLVTHHDPNRAQFQSLGANNYLVTLVTSCAPELSTLKLRVKALYAIAAMVEGVNAVAKVNKHEVLECEHARKLVHLVAVADDPRLCAAWCFALAMLASGSSGNQRKLVDAGGVVELLVQFVLSREHAPLRVCAAQLLAYLAVIPENRAMMMHDGGDALLTAVIDALQSDVHELQRFTALLVANLATRSDENKVRLGASGVISPLVDRLSSKQLNVLENVLSAVTKLGSHAGNKVKFGSKVCFEKLLALVHHDELAIRKSAVSAIAVLIEGNDVNKKFLLQCEASVVTELCALMKSANGKVVESAMLILGELSLLPDQTLEISKFIDIVVIVRMIEHVNIKIKRAALTTVMNLTKESFNKLRFGIRECIAALLLCLKSDDLLIVELAISCLANLSFTAANASQIAQSSALTVLLKLAAASTTAEDYLTWKEARFLRLDKHNSGGGGGGGVPSERSPQKDPGGAATTGQHQPLGHQSAAVQKRADNDNAKPSDGTALGIGEEDGGGEWSDSNELAVYAAFGNDGQNEQVLDFSSFPSRQTSVLEQTLLVLSNCAEECRSRGLVEKVAIKVVCQTLHHPSELVKRCACFILAVWCKKDTSNQETATSAGILPTLIQLLNSPTLSIVEAAMYALGKLSYFGDNHAKMLQLDLLTTLVQGILRRPSNLAHYGLLDRALRLLGTLVTFTKVRQMLKSEEVVSDILTNLLQIHKDALAKNITRLVLAMLEEESLKFFLPKKTVTLLRAIFTDDATSVKTVRNVLRIFRVLAFVEEHKTTIALEDSGEALGKMVQELHVVAEVEENLLRMPASAPNADTILPLLANIAATRRITAILFDKKVYTVLPQYLARFEPSELEVEATSATDDDDSSSALASLAAGGSGDSNNSAAVLCSLEQLRHLELNAHAVVIAKHLCMSQSDKAVAKLSSLECTSLLLALMRTSMELMPSRLTLLSFECLVVLERLCSSATSSSVHDQQVLFHEAAVEVLAANLELWLRVAVDGDRSTPPVILGRCEALDAVMPVEFIAPLAQLLSSMATHPDNRNVLVFRGGMLLLLQTMNAPPLPSDLRLCCAKTFAVMSELSIAKDFFDRDDHVSPLIRFMHAHERHAGLLLCSLRALSSIMDRSPVSRHHVLAHPPALIFLLECLADAQSDSQGSKVYYAVRSLECLSMEKEVARCIASLTALPLVPRLLLLPLETISRETQYFATEMVGHMAFFGHAEQLQLEEPMVARILAFAAFSTDPLVNAASIKLALWSLAQLAKSTLSARVCKWIADDASRLDTLIQCGVLPPQELGITSVAIGYALSIIIRIIDVEEVVSVLVRKRICTPLSALLEAIEQDIRIAALKILSLLLPRYASDTSGSRDVNSASDGESRRSERWPTILRHVVEWMEVYARDPASCSVASMQDAYVCLSYISSLSSPVAHEFQTRMLRTGVAEIVASTLRHFDLKQHEGLSRPGASGGSDAEAEQTTISDEQRVLLLALQVAFHLMQFSAAYSDKLLALDVPSTLESILHVDDAGLQLQTLACMNHMATVPTNTSGDNDEDDRHLLFASYRCVTRLKQLANEASDLAIVARATSLLALMAAKLPTLPGLCCLDGINVVSRLVLRHWSQQRSAFALRVTEDGCAILLAMFVSEENVFALYDQTSVVTRLFEIVETYGAPELPLRVLAKISDYAPSHARFIALLPALCRLLLGDTNELGDTSHNLILTVLFNVFCHDDSDGAAASSGDTGKQRIQTLAASERAVLPQILPLSRWVPVSNTRSVEIVLRLLLAFVSVPMYKTLLNDGANTLALLELVGADTVEVAVAAAQVLLCASDEREMQISITVEDGIGSLVRMLQRATHWQLQCLILTILRNMSPDTEVQVLILNDNGAARLVQFVNERKGVLFASDERLALACEILRQLSHTPSAAAQIVASHGHTSIAELNTLQLASDKIEDQRVTTLEVLANLARADSVVPQLVEMKLHELFLRANRDVRHTLGAKRELVPLLEGHLARSELAATTASNFGVASTAEDSLALLQLVSKTQEGRASIFAKSSALFVERVCSLVSRASPLTIAVATPTKNSVKSAAATPTKASALSAVAIASTKLLANLLTDTSQERKRVSWQYTPLVALSPLLECCVANHQQPKLQLTALRVLSGAFLGSSFYFPLSPQMLSDLLNVLLISASRQHCALAEDVVVHAFSDTRRVRASIGGNQILEQLLIVVTQKAGAAERRALGSALTEVLYVSVAHDFVVNQRFLSKILSLLMSLSEGSSSSSVRNSSGGDASSASTVHEDTSLARALCVYLSSVFKTASSANALQSNIREVLRSEVNATAFESVMSQVVSMHAVICRAGHATSAASVRANGDALRATSMFENLLLWNLFAECLAPPVQHVQRMLESVGLLQWLCLVDDFFSVSTDLDSSTDDSGEPVIAASESAVDNSKSSATANVLMVTDSATLPQSTGHMSLTRDDAVLATLKVMSVLTRLGSAADVSSPAANDDAGELQGCKQRVATWCLRTLWAAATETLDQHHASVEAALTTLLDVRDGWGESCLLAACKSFASMAHLLVKLLKIFHSPYRALNRSRHLLLQLLLTLVSTGSFVDELKASDIQRAIENNELIAATDKALPLTILSLLGYSADLNSEFALALGRCVSAESLNARNDHLAYLVNFLQLYALTDETLQQRAISVFMHELVANAAAVQTSDAASSGETHVIAATALTSTSVRLCVAGLVKISAVRKFVELYLHEWTLNALLGVALARMKGDASNDFQERAYLPLDEISQLLELAARICSWLGTPSTLSTTGGECISERNVVSALTLIQSLTHEQLPLIEQVLELLAWLLGDAECFQHVCHHAPMLNAFLPWLFEYSDSATTLLLVLETCIRNAPRVDYLNELLLALLEVVYTYAAQLSTRAGVRDKLLLYILLLMKRLGEEGLSGSDVYEHAVQLVLANIRAPSDAQARITWSLLGMLTEFDPAIVTIFNFDGVPMLLREFCADMSPPPRTNNVSAFTHAAVPRSHQTAGSPHGAFQMEALKCLSKSARAHDEVLLKIGETEGIATMLFTVLANATVMIARDGGGSGAGATAAAADIGDAQEHAAHLIARIASQENLRASLLSQDHVSVLIESMESVHLNVVLFALEALYNLCEFAMCLDALVRHATVPVLGQILFSPLAEGETQCKTEEFVLGILGSMCAKSKLICRRVVSSNLVAKLNGYLRSSRTSVQHSAAWIVHSLSKDTELVPKLRDHGVLETLTDELLDYDPRSTQCKALAALANLLALSRVSIVATDPALARAVVRETVEAINRNIPLAHAQQAIAKGLRVFEALAVLDSAAKALLLDESAVQITLALLGAPDTSVRLKALQVVTKWVAENQESEQIRELFEDAVLLNLVRAISEELGELLLVALALLHLLLADDVLNDKLTSMTYEVLLRLVVTQTAPSLTATQSKMLMAVLQCLTMMTTKGNRLALSTTSAEIVNSVEPLIMLLRTSVSDSIRVNALHLLVNFAAAIELRGAMLRGGMLAALVTMLRAAANLQDSKVVQLCLLGMALLTAVDFSSVVADLAGANIVTLVELLESRHPNIQANAVWVLSNISSEESLRSAIVELGGATTLQAILNEALSSSPTTVSSHGEGSTAGSSGSVRPTSSSMRIREYAPKAIRSLGFAPWGE